MIANRSRVVRFGVAAIAMTALTGSLLLAGQDPAVVNAKTIAVKLENERVRVLEANIDPGTRKTAFASRIDHLCHRRRHDARSRGRRGGVRHHLQAWRHDLSRGHHAALGGEHRFDDGEAGARRTEEVARARDRAGSQFEGSGARHGSRLAS